MIVHEKGKRYVVVVKTNGDKYWYFNDKLHREAGPAIELAEGGQAWYLNGEKVKCANQKEFDRHVVTKVAEQLKYYDVVVEVTMPATLTYKLVQASSPEEALEKSKRMVPAVKYHRARQKSLKATIFDASSTLIRLIKNLV